jgi:hypothetical protein
MKRSACMSLGEFREATKDMPDHTCLMVVSSTGYEDCALALQPYPFCTTLDQQDVYLFQLDPSESVTFSDC